jgi:hypothetical protein
LYLLGVPVVLMAAGLAGSLATGVFIADTDIGSFDGNMHRSLPQ